MSHLSSVSQMIKCLNFMFALKIVIFCYHWINNVLGMVLTLFNAHDLPWSLDKKNFFERSVIVSPNCLQSYRTTPLLKVQKHFCLLSFLYLPLLENFYFYQ